MENKKSVMGQVISVFVLILIVSILAGLTFLFVSEIKSQTEEQVRAITTTNNEAGWVNETDYTLRAAVNDETARSFVITGLRNATRFYAVSGNISVSSIGVVNNVSAYVFEDSGVRINYTYFTAANSPAYKAINDTEAAGTTVINYLPLIFLALIFGVILTLVLKIILPYINLGQQVGGF